MQRQFHPPFKTSIMAALIFMLLVGLGVWQLQRLTWKTEKIAEITAQMAKAPVPLPEKITAPSEWEYRRVTMAGQFLSAHEFLVQPRVLDGITGYHMVVPFQRLSGEIVMVNRGWISDTELKKASRPSGVIQIEGILHQPQTTYFTPANAPAKNNWYSIDTDAMGSAAHLQNISPVVVHVATKQDGVYPLGGKIQVTLPNDHRQYAIFWFVMSFVFLLIFFIRYYLPVEKKETPLATL